METSDCYFPKINFVKKEIFQMFAVCGLCVFKTFYILFCQSPEAVAWMSHGKKVVLKNKPIYSKEILLNNTPPWIRTNN